MPHEAVVRIFSVDNQSTLTLSMGGRTNIISIAKQLEIQDVNLYAFSEIFTTFIDPRLVVVGFLLIKLFRPLLVCQRYSG